MTLPPMQTRRLVCSWLLIVSGLFGLVVPTATSAAEGAAVRFHAAPEGEPLSTKFSVRVDGRALPVYVARVASADPQRRFRAMDDKVNSAEFFDESAFVSFDLLAPARLIISAPAKILSARVLPTASGVVPQIAADGSAVSVAVDKPGPLVLEINGDVVGSLQIFANPPERDVPRADAPGVMFFGPGIHEVDELRVPSGNTLYLADGAILRGRPAVERKGGTVVIGGLTSSLLLTLVLVPVIYVWIAPGPPVHPGGADGEVAALPAPALGHR